MRCPHCDRELDKRAAYLMASDPQAEWPWWGKWGIYFLAFLALFAAFAMHAG